MIHGCELYSQVGAWRHRDHCGCNHSHILLGKQINTKKVSGQCIYEAHDILYSSLLLSQAIPVNPSLHAQFPSKQSPLLEQTVLRCAVSVACATSLKANPSGHVCMEQSPPSNPEAQSQVPKLLHTPLREHLLGHCPMHGSGANESNANDEKKALISSGLFNRTESILHVQGCKGCLLKTFRPRHSFRLTQCPDSFFSFFATTCSIARGSTKLTFPLLTTMTTKCDQTEHNFVADAFNWEQRVRGELQAARAWSPNWGSVYAPNAPKDYSEKIAKLKEKMEKLPVQAMMSNSQMSYTEVRPYKEYGKSYGRKNCVSEDDA